MSKSDFNYFKAMMWFMVFHNVVMNSRGTDIYWINFFIMLAALGHVMYLDFNKKD